MARQYSATSECYGGLYVDILELLIRTSDIHLDVVSLANVGNESLGVVLVKELQSGQTKLGLDNPVMTKERIAQYAISASHQTASLTIVVHKNKFIRLGRSTTSRLFGSLKPFSVNVWILSMSSLALWALHCAVRETLNLLQQREWDDRQVFSQIFQRLPRSGFGIFGTSLGQLNYFNGNSTSQLIGSWIFFSCVLTLFALFGGQLTMVFSNNEPQPPFSTLDEFIDSKFRLLAFESSTLRSIQTNRESRYRKLSMKIDALNNSGGNNATSDFEGTAFRRAATENYAVLINSMRIPQLAAMADFPLRVAVPEFFALPVGMILMNKNDSDRGILDQNLQRLFQAGLINHLLRLRNSKSAALLNEQILRDKHDTYSEIALSIQQLESCFWLLLLLHGTSCLICLFEVVRWKISKTSYALTEQ